MSPKGWRMPQLSQRACQRLERAQVLDLKWIGAPPPFTRRCIATPMKHLHVSMRHAQPPPLLPLFFRAPVRRGALPRLCFLSYRQIRGFAMPVVAEYTGRAEIEVVDGTFGDALAIA